jgi:oxygen-independent coproporphyrinogen-3 oxidase
MQIPRDLIDTYDLPVPRYTSYPTAVQFVPADTDGTRTQVDKLAVLPADEPVSLYLHIPFCHQLCLYCGCHTKIVNRYEPVEHYLTHLLEEIRLTGQIMGKRPKASLIHFGGGSPNSLRPQDMERVFTALFDTFTRTADTKISLELDPRVLTDDAIKSYKDIGITRASLGVQDINADVQKAVDRIQPFELIREKTESLRAHGVDCLNFDLMVGLPLQTTASITESFEKLLTLSPDRAAVFAYAHVPWMKKHQTLIEKNPRGNGYARYEMAETARQLLIDAGYGAIGIDHFAKPHDPMWHSFAQGRLRRNFQGYTEDECDTLIGFGLSAISSFGDLYTQNTTSAPEYHKAITEGRLPTSRICRLNQDDLTRRSIIERLMCYFKAEATVPPNPALLDSLLTNGLVTYDGKFISITEKGRPFARLAAACFDAYWREDLNRHARAI